MTKLLSDKALSLVLFLVLLPCIAISIIYFWVFFRRVAMSNQNLIASTAPIIRRAAHQDTPIVSRKKAQNSEETLLINSSAAAAAAAAAATVTGAGDQYGLVLEGNDNQLRQLSSDEDEIEEAVDNSSEDGGENEYDDVNEEAMSTNEEQPSTTTRDNISHNAAAAVVVKKRNINGIDGGKVKKQPPPKSVTKPASTAITVAITGDNKGSENAVSSGKKRKEVHQEVSEQVHNKSNAEIDKTKQAKRVKKTASSTTQTELTDAGQKCQSCIVHQRCARALLKAVEEMLATSIISNDNGQ